MNAEAGNARVVSAAGKESYETGRARVVRLHQAGLHEQAQRGYADYLQQNPADAAMWANYGVLLRTLKHYPAAIACYRRALSLKPDDAGVLSNLGNVLKDCDRLEEAVACQQRAVALAPENRMFRLNYAVALREAKYFEQSLAQLNLLLQQEPENAGYQWERGLVNLYLGNFAQGWVDYEARWRTGELPLADYGCPRWQGEDLNGKRLLLVAEQGYGDTILAARFIALVREKYPSCDIHLQCKAELHRLFAGLGVVLHGAPSPGEGYFCPLMSLMGMFNIDDSNVPPPAPLYVPEAAKNKFSWLQEHAPGKKKIGIVWSGSLTFKDNAKRAATLEQFFCLAQGSFSPLDKGGQGGISDIQLYSFQKGPRQQDLQQHGALPLVCDLADQLEDFADTAAAVLHMDAIVMTDSSLAHLAASLGKPVINLLQYKPYWLYSSDERMNAWYPAMRAIRQECPGEWDVVFDNLPSKFYGNKKEEIPEGYNKIAKGKDGYFLYNKNDIYIGGAIEKYGEFSGLEMQLLKKLCSSGDVVIDVGANIGAHTVGLARHVGENGKVLAFEPQRLVFQTLCGNVALNSLKNVDCYWAALGATEAQITVPEADPEQRNNFGGISLLGAQQGHQVPCLTLDSMLSLPSVKLLKIDVEGMEEDVIMGGVRLIEKFKPFLYVENDRQEKSESLVRRISSLGYRMFWHLPPLFNEDNHYGKTENIYNGTVSVNMICIPHDVVFDFMGTYEVTDFSYHPMRR